MNLTRTKKALRSWFLVNLTLSIVAFMAFLVWVSILTAGQGDLPFYKPDADQMAIHKALRIKTLKINDIARAYLLDSKEGFLTNEHVVKSLYEDHNSQLFEADLRNLDGSFVFKGTAYVKSCRKWLDMCLLGFSSEKAPSVESELMIEEIYQEIGWILNDDGNFIAKSASVVPTIEGNRFDIQVKKGFSGSPVVDENGVTTAILTSATHKHLLLNILQGLGFTQSWYDYAIGTDLGLSINTLACSQINKDDCYLSEAKAFIARITNASNGQNFLGFTLRTQIILQFFQEFDIFVGTDSPRLASHRRCFIEREIFDDKCGLEDPALRDLYVIASLGYADESFSQTSVAEYALSIFHKLVSIYGEDDMKVSEDFLIRIGS